MGRRPVHTAEAMLDAAVDLFAAGGAEAVTMTAIASGLAAPSGSVYHRFADRPTLLARMWLRTAERFESGYSAVLGGSPSPHSAIAAAVWTVAFCRAHPGEAAVLHAGPRTLQPHSWPSELDLEAHDTARHQAVVAAVRHVAKAAGRPRDEVSFAMFDLPLSVVRPYLSSGAAIPASAEQKVRRLATRILVGDSSVDISRR